MPDIEDEVEVEDEMETDAEEGDDNPMYGPGVADLVSHSLDQKPLEFQQTFNDLLQQRIGDAVEVRKVELAGGLAGGSHNDELEDGDEGEAEEVEAEDEYEYEDADDQDTA